MKLIVAQVSGKTYLANKVQSKLDTNSKQLGFALRIPDGEVSANIPAYLKALALGTITTITFTNQAFSYRALTKMEQAKVDYEQALYAEAEQTAHILTINERYDTLRGKC